jgi:TonB family protein
MNATFVKRIEHLDPKAVLCALLAFHATVAAAQGPVVAGQVVDSASGDPLPDILVFAREETSHRSAKAVTDDRGLFVLPLKDSGAYRLLFSKQCRRVVYGPLYTLAGDTTVQRKYVLAFTPFPADSVFTLGEQGPARIKPTSRPPVYPSGAERAGVDGRVDLEFVVDTAGKVEMKTLRVLKSTGFEFTNAVIRTLPRADYEPAEVCGQHFRQRIQQRFEFKIPFR